VSELHDRLNELAGRGTPRGFDAVLGEAAETARRSGADRIAAVPDLGSESDDGDLDAIPFVTTEPIRRRRRPLGSLIAAAGVATLLLVGTFAVSALIGSGGGSGSAEGAVRRLADALSHEDPLAAADVLAPSEVRSLHGTLDAAAQKAKELQLVQTAGAPLSGVDFDVSGLKLSSQSLGDGYEKVTVDTGTFSASTHKTRFSPLMQKILREADDNSAQADLATLAASDDLPTFVVAIREEGRWYVSTAYTVLEYAREVNKLPAADFGSGVRDVATLGADSPDAAVQDAMRALQAEDWSKLMTMVSPREIPFYDYRAAFTELIRRNQDESKGTGTTPAFTIGSMKTTADVSGDTAKVTLTASGTTPHGTWSLDGGCFKASNNDATDPQFQYPVTCGVASSLTYFSVLAFPLMGADPGSQFTAVRQDGRWFVSPVGTVLDVVDRTISQLDKRTVYSILNVPDRIPFDGALALGRPVVLSASPAMRGLQVLSFEGHRGEALLGLATSKATGGKSTGETYYEIPAGARVFGPDGSEIAGAGNLLSGHALTLPADGTYKFVLQMRLFTVNDLGDVTVTIWHTADAPAEAKTDRGSESCDYMLLGSSCSSSSGTATPVGPADTSSGNGVTCTTEGSARLCTSPVILVPTSVVGNGDTCTSTATEKVCTGSAGTSGSIGLPLVDPGSGSNSTVTPTTIAAGSSGDNSRSSSETSSVPHG
jgi:hypothetical protein